jgi:hypothetical protein
VQFSSRFFADATGTRSCPKNRSKKFSVQKHRAEETEITVASYCRVLAARPDLIEKTTAALLLSPR